MIYGVRTLHYEMPRGSAADKGRVFIPEKWNRWIDGWIEGMKRGRGIVGGGFGDEEDRSGLYVGLSNRVCYVAWLHNWLALSRGLLAISIQEGDSVRMSDSLGFRTYKVRLGRESNIQICQTG
jgi:hypothetical protein